MILSASSASTAKTCWKKAFNIYHRGIQSTNFNLVDGGAAHKGFAVGLATKDWKGAQQAAVAEFDKRLEEMGSSLEFDLLAQNHRELVEEMVKAYQEGFAELAEEIRVVQPECEFRVPIPHSEHNCIFEHFFVDGSPGFETHEMGTLPTRMTDVIRHKPFAMRGPKPEDILAGRISSPHPVPDPNCHCWKPHYLVGTTDAIVMWKRNLWLLEHKTTAIEGEQFWAQFRLNIQPTIYIYGVSRSLRLPVQGFILNAIRKPSEKQVSAWNQRRKSGPLQTTKDYIRYSKEIFTREESDLLDLEKDIRILGNDWERKILEGYFGMANVGTICTQYNKLCQFHPMCVGHDSDGELIQLLQRSVKVTEEEEL